MATKKKTPVVENESAVSVIDPLYKKYVKSVVRALGTTEFYEYFMESVAQAENEIQFSNRRMEKLVDTNWIDAIENARKELEKAWHKISEKMAQAAQPADGAPFDPSQFANAAGVNPGGPVDVEATPAE